MGEPGDPLEAGLMIARALEAQDISYAVGGALAYGLWSVPRATVDIDINVFTQAGQLDGVFAALRSLGVQLDEEEAIARNERDGMFVARFGLFRVDVFTPSIDFSWEAERTKVRRSIEGQEVDFLSAEALAVFKLMFFRAKDLVDLQRLLAVQGSRLDVGYVRQHIVDMLGEDDPRVARWDELVSAHGSLS